MIYICIYRKHVDKAISTHQLNQKINKIEICVGIGLNGFRGHRCKVKNARSSTSPKFINCKVHSLSNWWIC